MDPETMTVDELDAESVRLKGEINALRDERRAFKRVRERKVQRESIARELRIAPDDPELTDEFIATYVGMQARVIPTRREGDVVVTPGNGILPLRGGTPEVRNDDNA